MIGFSTPSFLGRPYDLIAIIIIIIFIITHQIDLTQSELFVLLFSLPKSTLHFCSKNDQDTIIII